MACERRESRRWRCRGCGAPCWSENEYWALCDVCGTEQRFKDLEPYRELHDRVPRWVVEGVENPPGWKISDKPPFGGGAPLDHGAEPQAPRRGAGPLCGAVAVADGGRSE